MGLSTGAIAVRTSASATTGVSGVTAAAAAHTVLAVSEGAASIAAHVLCHLITTFLKRTRALGAP